MRLRGVEDKELRGSLNSRFSDSLVDSFLIIVFQRHDQGGVDEAAIKQCLINGEIGMMKVQRRGSLRHAHAASFAATK